MGLFDKLKQNIHHGGIKLELQAPEVASMKDGTLPVILVITATDQQQTITGLQVELLAIPNVSAASAGQQQATSQAARRSVGIVSYNQPFTIMPGETKTVPLSLVMNIGAAIGAISSEIPGAGAMASQMAGALKKLQELHDATQPVDYQYRLEGSASIQGLSFGAATQRSIQLLRPGSYSPIKNLENRSFEKEQAAMQQAQAPNQPATTPLPTTPAVTQPTAPQAPSQPPPPQMPPAPPAIPQK